MVEAPGFPLVDPTLRPATRPANAVIKFSLPESSIVFPSTCCTEEPILRFTRFKPNSAVITTSPRTEVSSSKTTLAVVLLTTTSFFENQ
ncbi:hypothetical protein OEG92_13690 [Polaribacter sejongensis]|uniref:hypothetical protein n=1 Tax=Polaribacter sejongensis TaxID=985043 RepID=UPI0035A6639C